MRRALLAAVLLAACASPPAPDARDEIYLSIGADAVPTARAVAATQGVQLAHVESTGEVAVLSFPADDLDELSHAMHEQHGRCGGFMVHDSLAEARTAPAAARPGPDYTLDRAPAVRAVLPALDASRILGTIQELSAMQNRYYQSETGAAASTWLRDRWRGFTLRPDGTPRPDITIELFDHGYAQKSVILTIPGSTRPDEVVVIGGHLDSIAFGGKSARAPGADDDASGIATLTETLRALLANDFRPARTVKFMAYAAEEVGLRGSLAISKDYKKRGINVVGALQLDMTNRQGSDKDIWIIQDFTSAAQNAFLVRLIDAYVGASYGFDVCGYACSDHAAWDRSGVPASMPFESRSKDMNKKIHTREDTLEASDNNARHAVKFARLAAAYAVELGKGELGPPAAEISEATGTPGDGDRATLWRDLAIGLALGLGVIALSRRIER